MEIMLHTFRCGDFGLTDASLLEIGRDLFLESCSSSTFKHTKVRRRMPQTGEVYGVNEVMESGVMHVLACPCFSVLSCWVAISIVA